MIERRAQDYFLSPEGLVNVPVKNYSFLVGAGSLSGTARDLYRLGEAVLDGTYGEGVKASLLGQTTLSGSGSSNGHRAYYEIERNNKYAFCDTRQLCRRVRSNSKGCAGNPARKRSHYEELHHPEDHPNPNKNLSEFLGRYKQSNGSETVVELRNGFLYKSDIKLYPTKPDCFFEYRFFGDSCFMRDEAGKIKQIKWKGYGFDFTWVKQ